MAAPKSVIDVTSLIVGPCSYFGVDGLDLGGTMNGVQVEKKQTLTPVEVDQLPATLKNGVQMEEYTVKTELPAATLANLQLAWGLTAAPVTDVGAGTQTLDMGISYTVPEHALTFVGPAPGGKTRTYTTSRAIAMVQGAQDYDRKKQLTIPVEFSCLPDLPAVGSEYGTVVDQ